MSHLINTLYFLNGFNKNWNRIFMLGNKIFNNDKSTNK